LPLEELPNHAARADVVDEHLGGQTIAGGGRGVVFLEPLLDGRALVRQVRGRGRVEVRGRGRGRVWAWVRVRVRV
jgi:hypothetical protein